MISLKVFVSCTTNVCVLERNVRTSVSISVAKYWVRHCLHFWQARRAHHLWGTAVAQRICIQLWFSPLSAISAVCSVPVPLEFHTWTQRCIIHKMHLLHTSPEVLRYCSICSCVCSLMHLIHGIGGEVCIINIPFSIAVCGVQWGGGYSKIRGSKSVFSSVAVLCGLVWISRVPISRFSTPFSDTRRIS